MTDHTPSPNQETPMTDHDAPTTCAALRGAWADGYYTGAADEREHPNDPKFKTPSPYSGDASSSCRGDTKAFALEQSVLDLIARLTETGEWDHDGGCEGGDPSCMACTIEELRALVSSPTCPTCSGPGRETVGLVCQTCGTDYGSRQRCYCEPGISHAAHCEAER